MKYFLRNYLLSEPAETRIQVSEFNAILDAKDSLIDMLNIEEQWDCVLQNFIEWETAVLRYALQSRISDNDDYNSYNDRRLNLSRLFGNYLHSSRSYLDFSEKVLSKILKSEKLEIYKTKKNTVYDNVFGYRFLEALRNYSQHRGMPLDGMTTGKRWIQSNAKIELEADEDAKLHVYILPKIFLDKLRTDKKFKSKILNEIPADTNFLNLEHLAFEHLEGLGKVHSEFRVLSKTNLDESKAKLEETIENFKVKNSLETLMLQIESRNGDITIKKSDIFADFCDRILYFQTKNSSLVNLSKSHISTEQSFS